MASTGHTFSQAKYTLINNGASVTIPSVVPNNSNDWTWLTIQLFTSIFQLYASYMKLFNSFMFSLYGYGFNGAWQVAEMILTMSSMSRKANMKVIIVVTCVQTKDWTEARDGVQKAQE